ncbi:hypothetical protein M3765_11140 [Streptomyces thermoviolaceus]|uniref:hypothetical protein n=1 Tax=Streptomyces thermoviolaceus TaxID=1952 RepID=UPI00203D8C98|nr:hypothetical protein [Streptomyces thermoviolaceus]MCM3264579.1 hypothetical protein [Streptomyces thermoviolaceus]
MGEQPGRPKPVFARTNFEAMTHEQLVAMLESASHEGAQTLNAKLDKAASTISKIGDDLMQYVKDLEWQGEGADAFRDWGNEAARATLRLGQYAASASRWMGIVSQAIIEAKSMMPDTSETKQAKAELAKAHKTIAAATTPSARHDPDARELAQTAQSDAVAAEQRIERIRGEAIQQLRKLAQTYEYSADQVNSLTPPTFSPPAAHMKSPVWVEDRHHISAAPAGPTSLIGRGNRSYDQPVMQPLAATHATAHDVPETVTSSNEPPGTSHHVSRSEPVNVGLDGIDTLPHTPAPSSAESATPQSTSSRHDTHALGHVPGTSAPFGSGGQVPLSSPRMPSVSTPENSTSGRPLRLPRESGIFGGRPVSSGVGRAYNNIGRGTVIGSEAVQGRTSMPRTLHSQGLAPGATGSNRGTPSPRRLTSGPEGIIGSRQAQQKRAAGKPFTPGGSGLLRTSSSSLEQPHGAGADRAQTPSAATRPQDSQSDRKQGQRPGYLVEDDETWVHDNRRPLPPVVE